MKNSRGNLSEVLRKREEVINRIREKMPSEADALEALDMAAAALDANSPAMQAGESQTHREPLMLLWPI